MDNEFFYDADTEILYYHSSTGKPSGVVEATKLQTFVEVRGTQAAPVTNISFLGVGFRDTALSYLDHHRSVKDEGSLPNRVLQYAKRWGLGIDIWCNLVSLVCRL